MDITVRTGAVSRSFCDVPASAGLDYILLAAIGATGNATLQAREHACVAALCAHDRLGPSCIHRIQCYSVTAESRMKASHRSYLRTSIRRASLVNVVSKEVSYPVHSIRAIEEGANLLEGRRR